MGLDTTVSVLAFQLLWSLPACITVIVIALVAVVRRTDGAWWKLVVAGAGVILLAQVVNVLGTVVVAHGELYRVQWVVSLVTVVLNVVALALIGSGAVAGRRRVGVR